MEPATRAQPLSPIGPTGVPAEPSGGPGGVGADAADGHRLRFRQGAWQLGFGRALTRAGPKLPVMESERFIEGHDDVAPDEAGHFLVLAKFDYEITGVRRDHTVGVRILFLGEALALLSCQVISLQLMQWHANQD